ncbi:hypothetical protein [Virgibacillus pantothenticus]|nr:hypothetical protein [Virgibacillus pantothenticus]MEB5457942.1 hypothetical protein [Virgibacillus pantothenticus]MEB5470525.1 hypothetical protein [Virgibacillus pantothenticus]MED3735553.1 hypothetical protein [Virgibacillus pantothenticus]
MANEKKRVVALSKRQTFTDVKKNIPLTMKQQSQWALKTFLS